MGLTPSPIKSKIFLDLYLGKFFKTFFFLFWSGKFPAFSTGQVWIIVKYTNCNLLEHERIRKGIRTLEAQIDEKTKNIKARQNVTGSYKRKRVYFTCKKLILNNIMIPLQCNMNLFYKPVFFEHFYWPVTKVTDKQVWMCFRDCFFLPYENCKKSFSTRLIVTSMEKKKRHVAVDVNSTRKKRLDCKWVVYMPKR